jgi:minor extracellular serine protease Vpr
MMWAAAAAIALAGLSPPGMAAPPVGQAVPMADFEGMPTVWLVELKSAPAANGSNKKAIQSEHKAFLAAAASAGIKLNARYEFDSLWNGYSIQASPAEVNKIKRLDGVVAVWPVATIPAPEAPGRLSPDLFTAIQMTGADKVQNDLGFTGKGVKVAIMDTGIDVDHPAFGGDGVPRHDSPLFPSARVAYGYDFVGDLYNADSTSPTYNPVLVPDANPDDCGGHGTHVAGIAGANDPTNGLKGVAPDVTFGAYRVFGCEGSTTEDVMIAAMEMVLRDKMQVLNMSIGGGFVWPQSPTAVASTRLVERGVVVVASIGNSGANAVGSNLYAAGAPGLGEKVIGVASFDNTSVFLPYFTVNDAKIGYVDMTFAGPTPTSGTEEIVYVGRACNVTSGDSLLADPSGKVALIVRGTCSFNEKATFAIGSGAKAVVIYNSSPGVFNGTLGAPIDGTTPVVGISQADGLYIRAQATPTSMTWTDQKASSPSPTGGLISSFSSYGLAPDLSLKPDIGAPGGNIYSSYPLELGGYATLGGTSMASPHVAGAAALLLQAKPKTRAEDVRAILQNSADPADWFGYPGAGYLEPVNRQGAGMVDVYHAVLSTTTVMPGKIATGESEAGPFRQVLTLRNSSASPVTFDLSSVNALTTEGVRAVVDWWLGDAEVAFSNGKVTVPAGGSASVTATITPATLPEFGQYGGYIVFTPEGGGEVLRVPFAGFIGDYQGIQAITPTPYGFPWLAISYGGSFYGPVTGPDDWVYSMEGEDIPWFLVHFDHQVERFEAEIHDAKNGKLVHPVFNLGFEEMYLPHNSSATGFYAFGWDGSRIHSNGYNGKGYTKDLTKPLPDGEYVVVIRALKANGDAGNPDHWESWTSPVVAIDRP